MVVSFCFHLIVILQMDNQGLGICTEKSGALLLRSIILHDIRPDYWNTLMNTVLATLYLHSSCLLALQNVAHTLLCAFVCSHPQ